MAKIAALGEILLRLSTPEHKRFIQSEQFDVCYGGGEANALVSLSQFGYDTEFVTKVPDNPIGESAVASLRKYNVGTNYIVKGGDRLGIYFLESGSSVRASDVIYDRANSSIACADFEEFDFDGLFEDIDWFHFTGITPAISDKAAELTKKALICAKKHNVKVSVDLNFRSKLWSSEKAQSVMIDLMQYVDVCFGGNKEDAEKVLNIKPDDVFAFTDEGRRIEETKNVFEKMTEKFGFEYIVSSLRVSKTASDNDWAACIYSSDDKEMYISKSYRLHPIVDRVGGGDAMTGGIICGLLDGKNYKDALEFGVAAAAIKHTVPGDFNIVTREEVENLSAGDGSGRIKR